jgi:hypothetical protein
MAYRTWGKVLLAALVVGLLAGAGQLGFAYGLGIVRFARDFDGISGQWAAHLAWVAWFAMLSTVAGAFVADRLARRSGYLGATGSRIAYAVAAGAGAAAVAPLSMLPARGAEVPSVDAVTVAGLSALLGAVAGVFVALAVLLHQVIGWNVAAVTGLAWLLALISVAPSLGPDDALPAVRLGVLDPAWLGDGTAQRLAIVCMPAIAVMAGAGVGLLGRWRGHPVVPVAASGVVGPGMLALAYLIAGPGGSGDSYQTAPYWGAIIAVGAGALGSVLAAVVQQLGDVRGLGRRPAGAHGDHTQEIFPGYGRHGERPPWESDRAPYAGELDPTRQDVFGRDIPASTGPPPGDDRDATADTRSFATGRQRAFDTGFDRDDPLGDARNRGGLDRDPRTDNLGLHAGPHPAPERPGDRITPAFGPAPARRDDPLPETRGLPPTHPDPRAGGPPRLDEPPHRDELPVAGRDPFDGARGYGMDRPAREPTPIAEAGGGAPSADHDPAYRRTSPRPLTTPPVAPAPVTSPPVAPAPVVPPVVAGTWHSDRTETFPSARDTQTFPSARDTQTFAAAREPEPEPLMDRPASQSPDRSSPPPAVSADDMPDWRLQPPAWQGEPPGGQVDAERWPDPEPEPARQKRRRGLFGRRKAAASAPEPRSGPGTAPPSGPGTAPPSGPGTAPPSGPGTAPPSGPGTETPAGPGTALRAEVRVEAAPRPLPEPHPEPVAPQLARPARRPPTGEPVDVDVDVEPRRAASAPASEARTDIGRETGRDARPDAPPTSPAPAQRTEAPAPVPAAEAPAPLPAAEEPKRGRGKRAKRDEEYVDWVAGLSAPDPEAQPRPRDDAPRRSLRSSGRHSTE